MGRFKKTRREKNIKKDDYSGEWIVYKSFKRLKGPYEYGRFKTFREAKKRRDEIDKKGWANSLPDQLRIKVKYPQKYYHKNGPYYSITKKVHGQRRYYGVVRSEEKAKELVEALKIADWDWDKIPNKLKNYVEEPATHNRKYYYPTGRSTFHVAKSVNRYGGHQVHYGTYSSEEDAKKVVEWLKENDWDIDLPMELKVLQTRCEGNGKYYYKNGSGGYRVQRRIDNHMLYFGTFDTEEEAKAKVEELNACNWGLD